MNGIHLNGKTRGSEKPVPGCLGRMVNLFDLSISGNRLLSDKPYNDGDPFTLTGFFFFGEPPIHKLKTCRMLIACWSDTMFMGNFMSFDVSFLIG